MSLVDKRVLVVGASAGIGRAFALAAAQRWRTGRYLGPSLRSVDRCRQRNGRRGRDRRRRPQRGGLCSHRRDCCGRAETDRPRVLRRWVRAVAGTRRHRRRRLARRPRHERDRAPTDHPRRGPAHERRWHRGGSVVRDRGQAPNRPRRVRREQGRPRAVLGVVAPGASRPAVQLSGRRCDPAHGVRLGFRHGHLGTGDGVVDTSRPHAGAIHAHERRRRVLRGHARRGAGASRHCRRGRDAAIAVARRRCRGTADAEQPAILTRL